MYGITACAHFKRIHGLFSCKCNLQLCIAKLSLLLIAPCNMNSCTDVYIYFVTFYIAVPPSIVVRPPEMITTDVDDTIELTCIAYGSPIPTVTWSRPGCFDLNDTSETTSIRIYSEIVTYGNTSFRKSVMRICGIKTEDSNQYACTARNGISGMGLASPSVSFQMRVSGK